MPRPMPRVVTLREVKISREGECAVFRYADPKMSSLSIQVGAKLKRMTDRGLLKLHNDLIRARQVLAARYKHVAVEMVSKPQIEYFKEGYQWVPRGNVLRCLIDSDGAEESVIEIDDRRLSLQEFGMLLLTHEGWGMRLAFVPEHELHKTPKVTIK